MPPAPRSERLLPQCLGLRYASTALPFLYTLTFGQRMARPTKEADDKIIFIRDVDPKLYAAIKAAADNDERSLQNYLLRFLRQHFLKGESK